jgi:hypothetical protein
LRRVIASRLTAGHVPGRGAWQSGARLNDARRVDAADGLGEGSENGGQLPRAEAISLLLAIPEELPASASPHSAIT